MLTKTSRQKRLTVPRVRIEHFIHHEQLPIPVGFSPAIDVSLCVTARTIRHVLEAPSAMVPDAVNLGMHLEGGRRHRQIFRQ